MEFVQKHVVDFAQFAQRKAMQRFQAKTAVAVSTFFLRNDAVEFHKEVELRRIARLFLAIHGLFEAKSIRFRLKTKQIHSIGLSSKRDYNLLNCTQANGFVPQPFQRGSTTASASSAREVTSSSTITPRRPIRSPRTMACWRGGNTCRSKAVEILQMEKKRADMKVAFTGARVVPVYVQFGEFEAADLA